MKKYFLSGLVASLILINQAYSFDTKGLQPLTPYGIFSTFSAEGLEKGRTGIAIALKKSTEPDFYRFTSIFAHSVTDNTEIEMTINCITQSQSSVDGLEDISLGIKHKFFKEGKYGPSVAYLLNVSIPSRKDALNTDKTLGGGIIVSKKLGPVMGHANLFYALPVTNKFKDEITLAVGIDFSASHSFKILGEIYGKKNYSGKLNIFEARLGYRFLTSDNMFTTFGLGFDIDKKNREYKMLLSLTYLFPTKEKKIYESTD